MANKRITQKQITTIIETQLFEAFDEVAWRMHMKKNAAETRALEEFVARPVEDPPVLFQTAKRGPGYRQITIYLEPDLYEAVQDAKWRRPQGTTIAAVAAQAIFQFVKNNEHIPAPG